MLAVIQTGDNCSKCSGTGFREVKRIVPGYTLTFGGPPPPAYTVREICSCVQFVPAYTAGTAYVVRLTKPGPNLPLLSEK